MARCLGAVADRVHRFVHGVPGLLARFLDIRLEFTGTFSTLA
jgi:hypothetical protein